MRKGFSLVELSIVLVILGLLTGGILAGQSLIRAAELRAVTTEFNRYLTAVGTFRDKYFALPGDMTNATKFWGAAHATPATCLTTASSSALTCDGNGDGIILPSAGSNESYRYWQHLANAGFIEGTYDGITHGATSYSSTAANSPKSKVGTVYWFSWNWGTHAGNTTLFEGTYDNYLLLGSLATDNYPTGGALKTEEMWNIDTKTDDGKPAMGKMVSHGTITSCTNGVDDTSLGADYLLSNTTTRCIPIFRDLY